MLPFLKKKHSILCFLSFLFCMYTLQAQNSYYPAIRAEFNQDLALSTTSFVEQFWRIAGNTGFNASINEIERILQRAGYVKEQNGEADAPLTYRIETRPMRKPTWEPFSSSIKIVGQKNDLLNSSTNRNMIAVNSVSTPAGGVTAEVVYVGKGTKADWEGKNLKGKIIFGETSAGALLNIALKNGAIGVLSYSMPAYTQPARYRNSIQFQQLPSMDSAKQQWAIILSYEAREKLKSALQKGVVRVKVNVQTNLYASSERTIIANVRGTVLPDERFVYSAHIQEPGANDNASGVGTLTEMARVTAALVKSKQYTPSRTITFLWGDEIVSTRRYIMDDTERAKGIRWGLSLDMVGEDITKTGGSFLIEKMPDPSAVWTRGKDHHTEWGGSVLKESDLFPHYFNDFLINRCKEQAKENGWVVNANPFEGGSDHTPFLNAKIPGLLMWHFTDAFYHTDLDRIENVSAAEMKNVGVSALAAAFILCAGDETKAIVVLQELYQNAAERLETEAALSKTAVEKGGNAAEQKHILEVWTDYYRKAFDRIREIPVDKNAPALDSAIEKAKADLTVKLQELLAGI
jgi:aminopeptidase YwaD